MCIIYTYIYIYTKCIYIKVLYLYILTTCVAQLAKASDTQLVGCWFS